MNDTIIIEVETVNTCFGLMAKFWKGKSIEMEVDLKHVADAMYRITERYNNTTGQAVLFATK